MIKRVIQVFLLYENKITKTVIVVYYQSDRLINRKSMFGCP